MARTRTEPRSPQRQTAVGRTNPSQPLEANTKKYKTNPSRRWRAVLITLSILLVACALALNTTGLHVYSDAVIPVLMSLYRWKPFFWEAARYGMLIPFIAIPIDHPFWNLVFQFVVYAAALLAAPLLVARFVYGAKYGLAVGAAAGLVLIGVLGRTNVMLTYATPGQPYAIALCFCYGGLCFLELASFRNFWKLFTGWVLIAAAMWLCPTVALNAIPIIFVKTFCDTPLAPDQGLWSRFRSAARTARPLIAAVAVSFILSTAFTLSIPSSEGKSLTALLSMREWVDQNAIVALTGGLVTWFLDPVSYSAAIFAALYIAAILITFRSKLTRQLIVTGAAILLTGVVSEMLVLSFMRYIAANGFHGHYLFSCLLFLLIIPCAAIVIPLLGADRQPLVELALLASLITAAVASYGWPSVQKFRASLDRYGQYTGQIVKSGVTHLAGPYWAVWPAVFHANLRLHELQANRTVWAIADRSADTRDLWDTFDDRRNLIAALPGVDITPRLNGLDIHTGSVQANGGLLLYPTIPRRELQFRKEPLWPDAQVAPGLTCSLDVINGNAAITIPVDRRQPLELLGWAADVGAGKVPEAIGIELNSPENGRYFAQARRTARADVASTMNNPGLEKAGFVLRLAETRIPPGEYSINVLQASGLQAWSCNTHKILRVN